MHIPARGPRRQASLVGISSTLIATISLARGLSLLLSGRPRTLLRVLCIAAFDTLQVLRRGKRLPTPRLKTLAALLDFAACANAAFDHKAGRGCAAWPIAAGRKCEVVTTAVEFTAADLGAA